MPYLMLVGVTFIWSTNFSVGKALADFPPIFLGTARFAVAGVILAVILYLQKSSLPQKDVYPKIIFMGLTGVFIFNPLIYLGLHYTTSINATMINSLSPLTVALLSHFWLKERLTAPKITGLVLSIIGIAWIAGNGHLFNLMSLKLNPGDIIILLDTFVWAVYTILIKLSSKHLTPVQSTAWAVWTGLIFLVPTSFIENVWLPLPSLTVSTGAALIYLGLFPSVIAFFLWNTAVSKIGPTQAGIFYNLIPFFNALLASQFLNESLMPYHMLGGFLIISGVIISSLPNFRFARFARRTRPQ